MLRARAATTNGAAIIPSMISGRWTRNWKTVLTNSRITLIASNIRDREFASFRLSVLESEPLIIAVRALNFNLGNWSQTLSITTSFRKIPNSRVSQPSPVEESFWIAEQPPVSGTLSRKQELIAGCNDCTDSP